MPPAGIEDLREKREEISKQIRDEESEKAKIQQDLQILTKRLAQINESLARKVRTVCSFVAVGQAHRLKRGTPLAHLLAHPADKPCTRPPVQLDTRNEYDKVIQETEGAYLKILESSQTLLTVLKREAVNIQKKRQASS